MRAIVLIVSCLLVACGGGNGGDDGPRVGPDGLEIGPPPSMVVHIVTVASFTEDAGRLGDYQQVGQDGRIRIRADVLLASQDVVVRTIMHELGHAMGLSHMPGTWCIMDSIGGIGTTPCPAEVSGLASGVVRVYADSTPGLLAHVRTACNLWGSAAGRLVFAAP